MGYFDPDEYDDNELDFRFNSVMKSWDPVHGHYHAVTDFDQRRTIRVSTPEDEDEGFVFEVLEKLIDDIPAEVVHITVSNNGELLATSTANNSDWTMIPFYPSLTQFPPVPKVRRSQLTEIERLGFQVDHTTYEPTPGETKHVVFKYYINDGNTVMFWHEVNCTLRIPKHPNIVPLDHLVVDTPAGGHEVVVGFTTPFIAGGTLLENVSRVFKLNHLRQLTTAIDYLNLKLGIVHGGICLWNRHIDPETDDLMLFDFNLGAKLGWEGNKDQRGTYIYNEQRDDVKLAVFTLYEIITRDVSFREERRLHELDAATVLDNPDWKQHPRVCLEEGVEVYEYRRVLEEWVDNRKGTDLRNYKEAPESFDWPTLSQIPLIGPEGSKKRRDPGQMRRSLIRQGEPFLKWERPPSSHLPLPAGQSLLATGEIVYDASSEGTARAL